MQKIKSISEYFFLICKFFLFKLKIFYFKSNFYNKKISNKDLTKMFDIDYHTKRINLIYKRVFR